MNTRLAAAFRGSAQCRAETGAIQWSIRGRDRDSGDVLEILLSGAAGLDLPPDLPGAELHVRDEAANPSWELRAAGKVFALPVRSVQVHRGAAAAFAAALPRLSAPWSTRAGWSVLLTLLRVPGVAYLLRRIRPPVRE